MRKTGSLSVRGELLGGLWELSLRGKITQGVGITQCNGYHSVSGYPSMSGYPLGCVPVYGLGFLCVFVHLSVRSSDILLARIVRRLIGRKGKREVSLSLTHKHKWGGEFSLTHTHTLKSGGEFSLTHTLKSRGELTHTEMGRWVLTHTHTEMGRWVLTHTHTLKFLLFAFCLNISAF